jgi:hypothetical protein
MPTGWSRLGLLFVADKRTPFLFPGPSEGLDPKFSAQIEQVWKALKTGNKKALLTPRI